MVFHKDDWFVGIIREPSACTIVKIRHEGYGIYRMKILGSDGLLEDTVFSKTGQSEKLSMGLLTSNFTLPPKTMKIKNNIIKKLRNSNKEIPPFFELVKDEGIIERITPAELRRSIRRCVQHLLFKSIEAGNF
jgi:hypothetical protein